MSRIPPWLNRLSQTFGIRSIIEENGSFDQLTLYLPENEDAPPLNGTTYEFGTIDEATEAEMMISFIGGEPFPGPFSLRGAFFFLSGDTDSFQVNGSSTPFGPLSLYPKTLTALGDGVPNMNIEALAESNGVKKTLTVSVFRGINVTSEPPSGAFPIGSFQVSKTYVP